jgi:hypothetical protein
MIVSEAGAQDQSPTDTSQQAVGVTMRNRLGDVAFPSCSGANSNYQSCLSAGVVLSPTTVGPQPELDKAVADLERARHRQKQAVVAGTKGETHMRRCFLICCLLFLPLATFAQEIPNDAGDVYSLRLVRALLARPVPFSDSWTEKGLNRLGDGIAIALVKVLPAKELSDPQRIKTILPLIRSAFEVPHLVRIEVDRDPKLTLFLLSYFHEHVKDAKLRASIQETRSFVLARTGAKDK